MRKLGYQILHLFVFGNFYIAFCAVLMVWETQQLFQLKDLPPFLLHFIFFATLSSYSLHWYLSAPNEPFSTDSIRLKWTFYYRNFLFILFIISALYTSLGFWFLWKYFFYLAGIAFFTFLYTAPKIPFYPFNILHKIAIGKTLYLTAAWTFVSTFLPILLNESPWQWAYSWFGLYRFFLIYAICILFDWRDRPHDTQAGVKSLITYLSEKGVKRLYFASLLICLISILNLYLIDYQIFNNLILLMPVLILIIFYAYFSSHFSDYVYYLFLDGLMMLSAILRMTFI